MSIEKLARRYVDTLRRSGTQCGPGVDAEQIAAFEERYAVVLPSDFKTFLSIMDGMDVFDDKGMRFWPLSEIAPLEDFQGFFVFADFMIESHVYALNLRASDAPARVVLFDSEEPAPVAVSFLDFLSDYLSTGRPPFPPRPALPQARVIRR